MRLFWYITMVGMILLLLLLLISLINISILCDYLCFI